MDFAQGDFKIWVLVKQNLILAMFGKPNDSFCTPRNCCSCRSTEIAYIFNCLTVLKQSFGWMCVVRVRMKKGKMVLTSSFMYKSDWLRKSIVLHYECVFSEVHVCCCLKGASSTGSQQEKQIKSPWLRLLLWNHEDAAGVLFCKRCWLLIGWQWWSCMLKFKSFWSTTEAVAATPSC